VRSLSQLEISSSAAPTFRQPPPGPRPRAARRGARQPAGVTSETLPRRRSQVLRCRRSRQLGGHWCQGLLASPTRRHCLGDQALAGRRRQAVPCLRPLWPLGRKRAPSVTCCRFLYQRTSTFWPSPLTKFSIRVEIVKVVASPDKPRSLGPARSREGKA